jgi:hypothetical protein
MTETYSNPLSMTKKEIDSLVGKDVYVEFRKPDPIRGVVSDVRTCLGSEERSGIYIDGQLYSIGNIETLKIINK